MYFDSSVKQDFLTDWLAVGYERKKTSQKEDSRVLVSDFFQDMILFHLDTCFINFR